MNLLMMTIEATRLLQAQSSSSRRMAVGCQEIHVVALFLLILCYIAPRATVFLQSDSNLTNFAK